MVSGSLDRRSASVAFGLLLVVIGWGMLVVLTPDWNAVHVGSAPRVMSAIVYAIGSQVCHQRPDRSFVTAGSVWPVCARCTGMYGGGAAAAILCLVGFRRTPRAWTSHQWRTLFAVGMGPTAAIWMLEQAHLISTTNLVRAIVAVPAGCVVSIALASVWRSDGEPAPPEVNWRRARSDGRTGAGR
jgi:uncharacterized membrane protein